MEHRGVCFEYVITALSEGRILFDVKHPNNQNNLFPPLITEFYDDQERELYELIEGEGFLPDEISEKRKHELREDARSMFGEKQISIRLPEYDFVRIRRIAERKGVTYQMLISSVLRNFINKTLAHK